MRIRQAPKGDKHNKRIPQEPSLLAEILDEDSKPILWENVDAKQNPLM